MGERNRNIKYFDVHISNMWESLMHATVTYITEATYHPNCPDMDIWIFNCLISQENLSNKVGG